MRTALTIAAIALGMAIAAPAAADEPEPPPPAAAPGEAAPASPAPGEAKAPGLVARPPNAEPVRDVAPRPSKEPIGAQRFLGAIAGAVGFITSAVGGFLVISSLNLYNEAKDRCESRGCSTSDVHDGDVSRSRANAGGVVLVTGLALLGGGIALWFTAPKPAKPDPPPSGALGIAPTLGGLSAVGTF